MNPTLISPIRLMLVPLTLLSIKDREGAIIRSVAVTDRLFEADVKAIQIKARLSSGVYDGIRVPSGDRLVDQGSRHDLEV